MVIRVLRRTVLFGAALGAWAISAMSALAEEPKVYPNVGPPASKLKPIQVLLVTGVDLHNWRETSPVLVQQLQKDPRIEVRMVEDPHFLDSAALDRYQVIFLHFMNWKVPAPGEAARANLTRAVESGKGLVLAHFACGAWLEWPGFVELAGRVWNPKLRGHDPRGPFRIDIAMPEHPVMRGMTPFEANDELYTCTEGAPPIQVLATATSKVDQKVYPMAFILECGKGRVFHCLLGHDAKAMQIDGVGELFRREIGRASCRERV